MASPPIGYREPLSVARVERYPFIPLSLPTLTFPVVFFQRCREDDGIIIGSKQGYATRFLATTRDLRPSGRTSRGVKVMEEFGEK